MACGLQGWLYHRRLQQLRGCKGELKTKVGEVIIAKAEPAPVRERHEETSDDEANTANTNLALKFPDVASCVTGGTSRRPSSASTGRLCIGAFFIHATGHVASCPWLSQSPQNRRPYGVAENSARATALLPDSEAQSRTLRHTTSAASLIELCR